MARTILSVGQRRLLTVLLVLSAFMLGDAAYLWLSPPESSVLPEFYQWMLVLHVVIGIALLVPMAVFIVWHLRRALAMRNPRAVLTGLVLVAAMAGLAFTGLFMKEQGNSADNRWAYLSHQVLAFVIPLGYAVHRWLARHRPERVAVFRGALAPVAVLVVALGIHHATLPATPPAPQAFVERPQDGVDPFKNSFPDHGPGGASPDSAFFPASTQTRTGGFLSDRLLVDDDLLDPAVQAREIEEYGFTVDASLGAATCVRCHADTVDQWARSAHRFASFNNPFYRAAVEDLRDHPDRGRERAQWCAGCHDPAVMMAGDWMGDVDPTMPRSQAGLTCMACHAMDEVHGVGGNGNYRISDDTPDPYLFADAKDGVLATVTDLLVKAKPDVHKREMLKPVFRTSEYCATCHKVSLDTPVNRYRWVRGQNEYDAWHDSGVARNAARTFYLPETSRTCQDCHMPLVDAPLGDVAAKDGKVRSHLFLGPNTALPHIRGDERTLEEMSAPANAAVESRLPEREYSRAMLFRRLFSAAFWAFLVSSSIVLFPIAVVIWATTAPFDPRKKLLHRFTCFWASLYTWFNPAWPVTIEGREKIRKDATYVMVANHQSLLDILVLFRLFNHYKWVSKVENFRIPFIGWNMSLNRYIKLKRGDRVSIVQMMEACRETLAEGNSIMMFPEGTRSFDGQLRKFKTGAFELAKASGRPILPIVLNGTSNALPKRGFVLQGRHEISISILEEIPPEKFADESAEDLTERVRELIALTLAESGKPPAA